MAPNRDPNTNPNTGPPLSAYMLRAEAERLNARVPSPPRYPRPEYGTEAHRQSVNMPYVPPLNPLPYPANLQHPIHSGRPTNRFNGNSVTQGASMPMSRPTVSAAPAQQPYSLPIQQPYSLPAQYAYPGSQANVYSQQYHPAIYQPNGRPEDHVDAQDQSQGIQSTGRNSIHRDPEYSDLLEVYGPPPPFPSLSSLRNALSQPEVASPAAPQTAPSFAPQAASSVAAPQTASAPGSAADAPRVSRPNHLVIGLFALRLTRRLILSLDPYSTSSESVTWLEDILAPYDSSCELAKLKDIHAIEQFVKVYPLLVRAMIRQPKYRTEFMKMRPQMNEDREPSDEELRAMLDFADAAGEWGSVVPVPGKYAQRMERLAGARKMAE